MASTPRLDTYLNCIYVIDITYVRPPTHAYPETPTPRSPSKAIQGATFATQVKRYADFVSARGGSWRLKPDHWKGVTESYPYLTREQAVVLRDNKRRAGCEEAPGTIAPAAEREPRPEPKEIASEAEYQQEAAAFEEAYRRYTALDEALRKRQARMEQLGREFIGAADPQRRAAKKAKIDEACSNMAKTLLEGEVREFKAMHAQLALRKGRLRRFSGAGQGGGGAGARA